MDRQDEALPLINKIRQRAANSLENQKTEVTTLTSLVNEGKKIARLSGNRDLNEKIVKAIMETLEECGQLIPAIVVDATDVINQGLEVVDFTTGDIIREEEANGNKKTQLSYSPTSQAVE